MIGPSTTANVSPIITCAIPMPSIAVIPSPSIEAEEYESATLQRKPKTKTTTVRTDVRRKSAEPIVHIYSNM